MAKKKRPNYDKRRRIAASKTVGKADQPHEWTPVRANDEHCGCGRVKDHKLHVDHAAKVLNQNRRHWFEPVDKPPHVDCKKCGLPEGDHVHKKPKPMPHEFRHDFLAETLEGAALCMDCNQHEPDHRQKEEGTDEDVATVTAVFREVPLPELMIMLVGAHGIAALLAALRGLVEEEMTHPHLLRDKAAFEWAGVLITRLTLSVPSAMAFDQHMGNEAAQDEHGNGDGHGH